jgi:hypothetical protein
MTVQRRRRWGIVPALLALFCQLVGATALPVSSVAAPGPVELGTIICHGGDVAPEPAVPAPHHAPGDCTLCPICQSLAHGVNLLPPEVPALELGVIAGPVDHGPVSQICPRPLAIAAAQPRGPPSI